MRHDAGPEPEPFSDVLTEEVDSPQYGKIRVLRRDVEMSEAVRRGLLWERKLAGLFSRHVRAGSAVADVGANIGCHTIVLAHLVGSAGCVVAYEPQPLLARLLAHNVSSCEAVVDVRRVAVGGALGARRVTLPDYETAENPGGWSLEIGTDGAEDRRVPHGSETAAVDVVRLDDDLAPRLGDRPLDLLKMDVEGAELDALAGAERILASEGPLLVVETRRHLEALDGILAGVGYCSLVAVGTPAGADYAAVPRRREAALRASLASLEA
jgi:FkbM family methyltransferase